MKKKTSEQEAHCNATTNTDATNIDTTNTDLISVAAIRIAKQGIYDGTNHEKIDRKMVVTKNINGFSGYQVNQTNPLTPSV